MSSDFDMAKVMYGENAIHIPMWSVMQNGPPYIIAGATQDPRVMFGTRLTHALVIGEMIVRPHFVVASDAFVGRGASGFWTDNPSAYEWQSTGEILVETVMGRAAFERWR